ncbi:uncharacterized protein NECHADRAFT_77764 [Fusarium vanettenii 77-13-4]|uniref:C2H2-type domain-containing protein n=1 Tax=Fusarium vanettenii (strain ATCC MYA-4622 / CBS 123669 / FGSC 9596 / NRRL 45880 / 77-13-4) TaxID=660122 RepID=C7YM53_FUSV7|nr:uncharacterized protein NECHADRAFT_77764 [Fusarium vanettenii 77-13-4]EEU46883.1 predicted protein [Fusarium vanettenii 77-13-4]
MSVTGLYDYTVVMTVLDVVKKTQPILVLPVISAWLNAHQEPNFTIRQSLWAWTMNAVTNASLLHITLGLTGTHRRRMEMWVTWSTEQRRQALVSIRTGIKTPLVENELSGNTGVLAFRPFSEFSPTKFKPLSGESRRLWEVFYDTLVSIGAKYGLSPNDFQYYCTIPSSKGSGHRVFCPFHVLSRPQALAIGWDWHILSTLARKKLRIMRKFCNRHAEGAGYGEPQVTELVFIYWIAHHFSSKIQQIGNAFKASLCKGPDHRIAMRFGLVANKHLDPVNYIDLSQSTITFDTVTTNFGMMNYDSGAWDGIRRLLTLIPQQHAYWKVDRGLGSGPWAGVQDESIIPIPPVPEFEMEPLPIESWLQSGDTVSESTDLLKCPACHSNFGSIALLVQHNRRGLCLDETKSSADAILSGTRSPETPQQLPRQDAVDAEYWKTVAEKYKCPDCSKICAGESHFQRHMANHRKEDEFR